MSVYEEIERQLNYTFSQKKWLEMALTHSSFLNETKAGIDSNERLEFLGDSLLGFFVSRYLFLTLKEDEGKLSSLKAMLVNQSACRRFIEGLGLEKYLLVSKGEVNRGKEKYLADLYEAILGAILLDGGIDAAYEFFERSAIEKFPLILAEKNHNWKLLLQDYVQRIHKTKPTYEILLAEGPEHQKMFLVRALVLGQEIGRGRGLSKKEAEQQAAKEAVCYHGYADGQTKSHLEL